MRQILFSRTMDALETIANSIHRGPNDLDGYDDLLLARTYFVPAKQSTVNPLYWRVFYHGASLYVWYKQHDDGRVLKIDCGDDVPRDVWRGEFGVERMVVDSDVDLPVLPNDLKWQ